MLIYDGQCPVCAHYVKYRDLQIRFPGIRLVSARTDDPVVKQAIALGYRLNDDMLLFVDGTWLTGSDALLAIGEHGQQGMAERLMLRFLGTAAQRPGRYKTLVYLRKLLLRLIGRSELPY